MFLAEGELAAPGNSGSPRQLLRRSSGQPGDARRYVPVSWRQNGSTWLVELLPGNQSDDSGLCWEDSPPRIGCARDNWSENEEQKEARSQLIKSEGIMFLPARKDTIITDSFLFVHFTFSEDVSGLIWGQIFLAPTGALVTYPLISTIWCFRPYKPYIFCEDMILAMCYRHHMIIWWWSYHHKAQKTQHMLYL